MPSLIMREGMHIITCSYATHKEWKDQETRATYEATKESFKNL